MGDIDIDCSHQKSLDWEFYIIYECKKQRGKSKFLRFMSSKSLLIVIFNLEGLFIRKLKAFSEEGLF
jgi:hypothetical protein